MVLLGWAGCIDRHLSKYSQFYNQLGCISLQCIPSPLHLFVTPARLHSVAARLARLLSDLELHTHPLVLHSFSNGGAMLYWCLVRQLEQMDRPQGAWHVCGAVFDSGPLAPRILHTMPIVSYCFRDLSLCHRWLMVAAFVVCACLAHVGILLLGEACMSRYVPHPWLFRHTVTPTVWPELYLYSEADQVTRFKEVEEWVVYRRVTGAEVTTHRFSDSPHVLHLRQHPHQYRSAVVTWLRNVLPAASGKRLLITDSSL